MNGHKQKTSWVWVIEFETVIYPHGVDTGILALCEEVAKGNC